MKIVATQFLQLPLLGVVDNLEINVKTFPLFPTEIEVFWKVNGENVSNEGSIILPEEVIELWGTDDTVVEDYILQQLGLTKDTEITTTTSTTTIIEETTTTTSTTVTE